MVRKGLWHAQTEHVQVPVGVGGSLKPAAAKSKGAGEGEALVVLIIGRVESAQIGLLSLAKVKSYLGRSASGKAVAFSNASKGLRDLHKV